MYTENTITYKGYRITTGITEYCDDNPREWDNLGTIVAYHREYSLPIEAPVSFSDFNDFGEMYEYIEREYKPVVILSINAYEHSGISFSTSSEYPYNDIWDSGQVGFIYATKEDVKKYLQVKKITKEVISRVKKILEDEINTYTQYFNGEIYEYTVEKPIVYSTKENTESLSPSITMYDMADSCTGYYSEAEAEAEAKSFVDSLK